MKIKNGFFTSRKSLVVPLLLILVVSTSSLYGGNGEKADGPGDPIYGVIRGKLKKIDETTYECRRRRHACGFVVIGYEPGITGYAFPLDFNGPFPSGTFLDENGYMQNQNVSITETVENGEDVTYIDFN